MGVGYSEFDGEGVMPGGVHPKPANRLTASEQLMLQSLTGQDADTNAPRDPWHWYGNPASASTTDTPEAREVSRQRREREMERQQRLRYRQSR